MNYLDNLSALFGVSRKPKESDDSLRHRVKQVATKEKSAVERVEEFVEHYMGVDPYLSPTVLILGPKIFREFSLELAGHANSMAQAGFQRMIFQTRVNALEVRVNPKFQPDAIALDIHHNGLDLAIHRLNINGAQV